MPVKKVTVGRSQTINLGNYNSAQVSLTVESDVEKGEAVEDAIKRVDDHVVEWLNGEVKAISKKGGH